jgi:hypothetical protein
MGAFLKTLLGLSDGQAKSVFVWARVAAAMLAALVLLNAALWLVSALWSTSAASPFGSWGFLCAILIAISVGGLTFWRLTRRNQPKPPTSVRSASLADRYAVELADSPDAVGAEERKRWLEAGEETPVALRNRIKAAINAAETSGAADELEACEGLLQKLLTVDPGCAEWARSIRWEIAQMKKRL